MAKQRYINTHFWDDSFVMDLDPIEKLLFLYFLTNPLTNIAGAYEITIRRVAFDTGIDKDMVLKILARFEQSNRMIYRDGWILIVNFIKNQSFNPKILKGVDEIVKCCPNWIKDRLSITYESLSHLNLNRDLNSNSIETAQATFAPSESAVNPEVEIQTENYFTAVKDVYKTNTLSREDRWLASFQKAVSSSIGVPEYVAALKSLLADQTRKYPITPENVLDAALDKRAKSPPDAAPELYVSGSLTLPTYRPERLN